MTQTSENHSAISIIDCQTRLGLAGGAIVEFRLPGFSVAAGEQIALTGPSGCGKSTLLHLVSGLLKPDTGSVNVLGQDLASLPPRRIDAFRGANIGFVHQTFHLLNPFTAIENVLIGIRFGRSLPRSERRERAQDALERVGLKERINTSVNRLSVGERQRVAIARAIANRPRLMLADEPTGSLDPATAESVFELIQGICAEENMTMLFVTHDLSLADRFEKRFDCSDLIHHRETGGRAA